MKNPNPERYRQDGPRDQLTTMISSVYGDLPMLSQDGTLNTKIQHRAARTLLDMMAILSKMPSDEWTKE